MAHSDLFNSLNSYVEFNLPRCHNITSLLTCDGRPWRQDQERFTPAPVLTEPGALLGWVWGCQKSVWEAGREPEEAEKRQTWRREMSRNKQIQGRLRDNQEL